MTNTKEDKEQFVCMSKYDKMTTCLSSDLNLMENCPVHNHFDQENLIHSYMSGLFIHSHLHECNLQNCVLVRLSCVARKEL